MLVVKSKIKEVAGEMSVSSDFADSLDKMVDDIVKKAVERAKANNRKTIMPKDL